MSRDRWAGLLADSPFLTALAAVGSRRRFAEARALDEDGADEEPPELDAARLAAADEEVDFVGGAYVVRVCGNAATQVDGPSGLALRIQGAVIPLVRGEAVVVPLIFGDELEAIDRQGRSVTLRR